VCGARARAAASYRAKLSANAVKGQAAYVANWKAKNLKAGQQMVKDAAKLYAKWDLVDPYTGRSSPNMVVPHDTSDGYATTADGEAAARNPRMRLYKNGPMLTDAHLMMLKEVTADNGRTYILPWWCVVVHPEANGDGRPTGLSDAYGRPYPEGKGWDGAKTPMGASGVPGVDCTHPGGSTLVPYDKDWPLWKGPRVPVAAAEPISNEEAAELEEDEEGAAEEEGDGEEAGDEAGGEEEEGGGDENAGEEAGGEQEEVGGATEEPAAEGEEGAAEGEEGAAEEGTAEEPGAGEAAEARDVARQEMLLSEWPAGAWRHGINTDNALSKPVCIFAFVFVIVFRTSISISVCASIYIYLRPYRWQALSKPVSISRHCVLVCRLLVCCRLLYTIDYSRTLREMRLDMRFDTLLTWRATVQCLATSPSCVLMSSLCHSVL
jgi:hypothetical protein